MKIHWSPIRMDATYTAVRVGDALVLNGEVFDFASVPEGATLPAGAVQNAYFAGPVERIDGTLNITLLLPHGPSPSQAVAFPEPTVVPIDGPVEIPR